MLNPEQLEELYNTIKANQALPVWFVANYKTISSRNITIEDWNRLINYLKELAKNDNTLLNLTDALATQSVSEVTEILAETAARIAKDNELLGKISDAESDIASLQTTVGNLFSTVSNIQEVQTEQAQRISDLETDCITVSDTSYNYTLKNNTSLTFTNTVQDIQLTIPNTVSHGFASYVSLNASTNILHPSRIKFINNTELDIIRLVNSEYVGTVSDNWYPLSGGKWNVLVECNGNNVYIREEYLEE